MAIHEFGKGLDYKNGVEQIYCLEKDFVNVIPKLGMYSGSVCKIIDKGFEMQYEQETQQWYKQKVLANGELISPKTIEFLSTQWTLIPSNDSDYIAGTTLYKLIITHNLNTTLFDDYVYDSDNELMVATLSSIDANSIKIISDEIFSGKVVLI
jgi:hypothetical protein